MNLFKHPILAISFFFIFAFPIFVDSKMYTLIDRIDLAGDDTVVSSLSADGRVAAVSTNLISFSKPLKQSSLFYKFDFNVYPKILFHSITSKSLNAEWSVMDIKDSNISEYKTKLDDIHALSSDGSIVAGSEAYINSDYEITHRNVFILKRTDSGWDNVINFSNNNKGYSTYIGASNSSATIFVGNDGPFTANVRHPSSTFLVIWRNGKKIETKHTWESSSIFALNETGDIAAGAHTRSTAGFGYESATVWRGDKLETMTHLGDEILNPTDSETEALAMSGEPWDSKILAMSNDSNILAGKFVTAPTIWRGKDNSWKERIYLKNEKRENGGGFVGALSSDGSIAAGEIENIPYIWLGENWGKAIPLLPKNGEYIGQAMTLSADGRIVGGFIKKKNDSEAAKAVLWRISYENRPDENIMIDPKNTQKTINKLGQDTFELFSLQHHALRRLQDICVTEKGQFCYAVQHNYNAQNGNYDNALALRLGYGLTDDFTFGVNFDRSLKRSLPDSYRRLNNNGGVGLFAHYKLPHNGYISMGIGRDYYAVQAQRVMLENTEFAPARTKIKGLAWNITLGQDFMLSNNGQLGWYMAYRENHIKRDGYREDIPGFPIEYGASRLKDKTIAFGVNMVLPITAKLTWLSTAEIEQRVGGEIPVYSTKANYLGDFSYTSTLNHTRWTVQSGLRYDVSPNLSVSFTPYVGNSLMGSKQWGTKLSLEGRF